LAKERANIDRVFASEVGDRPPPSPTATLMAAMLRQPDDVMHAGDDDR
jgi:hypothetical protein